MEKNVSLQLRGLMGGKTLSALHIGFGFNYEAPLDVIRVEFAEGERWTVAALGKLLPSGALGADRVAVMVLGGRPETYIGENPRVIQIYADGRFAAENENIKRAAQVAWNSLRNFYAKSQFDGARKRGDFARAWMISQRAEYIRKPEYFRGECVSNLPESQIAGRRFVGDCHCVRQADGLQLKTRFYRCDALDKSGYRVDLIRDDLKRRAADLRRRRRAEAANAADYSADLAGLYAAARVLEAGIYAAMSRPGCGGVDEWSLRNAFDTFVSAKKYADGFKARQAAGELWEEGRARETLARYTREAREALNLTVPEQRADVDTETA